MTQSNTIGLSTGSPRKSVTPRRWAMAGTLAVAALMMLSALPVRSEPAKDKPDNASWPVFRGDPSFAGVCNNRLPASPKVLWKYKAKGGFMGSPVVADGQVFIADDSGNAYAVDLNSGKETWKSALSDSTEATPLVVDGMMYIGGLDGVLQGLDAKTGAIKWKFKTGEKIVGAANFFRVKDRKAPIILAGSHDYKMYGVDGATGEKIWEYETGNYINGAPAVIGNKAVFGGCDATVHVVNAETGEGIATIDGGAYIAGSIAVADNKAYYGHYENAVMCVDLEKQSEVWSYANEQSVFFSTPAVTKDRVVIGGRDMQVHCLDRATGKQLWKFPTKGEVDSSPVVSQDKVVVGSGDGRLYILNLADGKEVWSYDTGGSIMGSPVVLEGRILIGDTGGYLYCFGDKPKTDEKTPKDK